jgi:hypothetical protein
VIPNSVLVLNMIDPVEDLTILMAKWILFILELQTSNIKAVL